MNRYRIATCLALSTLAVFALTIAVYAADSQIGTWKLNVGRSKYDPASLATKSQTSTITAASGGIKASATMVDSADKTVTYDFTAKYDGKDYAVHGDPTRDTTAYTRIDDHTYTTINKKAGKVTTTVHFVYSADGKMRTLTSTGTNAQGQKINNVTVWDRQ